MTSRMNWLYLLVFAVVLALVPGPALAQTTCVESNTRAGIALADLNGHLDRIGSRLDTLDTIFSRPVGLIGLLLAQTTKAQLQADANNLSVELPELRSVLGQVLPGGLPNTIQTLPDVIAAVTAIVQSLLATIINIMNGLPFPGGGIPVPTADPARVAVSELRTDLQASRATLPPLCD